jgi:glycerophosphoryl diester phosphodiesterase
MTTPTPGPSAPPRAPRVEIQGHRGARAVLPENTLPAFRHAIEVGADVLELDVHVTKDDQLIVTHDPQISRDTCLTPSGTRVDQDVLIRSLTLAEAQAYDCGSLPNPRFPRQRAVPGTRMPSLIEVLELARKSGPTLRVNVEAKSIPGRPDAYPSPERFAQLLVDTLAAHGMTARATLQSFDHRILKAAHARAPKLVLAALVEENFVDHAAVVRAAHAQILSPPHLWIDAGVVRDMHTIGVRVVPWTANTEADWARLIGWGVDGIITDDPAGLAQYLRSRGLR